jgi:hypothetical protein
MARAMTDEMRKSLEYLERTARLLLDREHPQPRRAAYLMMVHAMKIEGASDEFPEKGWQ